MALDLERLLAPVSDDQPAGPDMAYDNGRYEIEQAFETAVSIDASGVETEAAEVDWRRVIDLIATQSEQTKDVWLAVYLCRAGAKTGALATVDIGARYLAGLLETYWPTVHPDLEEYGFQGRKGPCDSLTRLPEFITPLRRTPLLEHPRLGRFSGEDFERFLEGAENAEGYGLFRAALEDTDEAGLVQIVTTLDSIHGALKRADVVLTANAEGDTAPNFRPVYDAIDQMRRAVLAFTSTPAAAADDAGGEAGAEAVAGGGGESGGGQRIGGRVESRDDVIKAIDAIADYYRRREPGSPVPALLNRAREWVSLDFLSVLEDIAPGSLDEARTVLMSRRAQGE